MVIFSFRNYIIIIIVKTCLFLSSARVQKASASNLVMEQCGKPQMRASTERESVTLRASLIMCPACFLVDGILKLKRAESL